MFVGDHKEIEIGLGTGFHPGQRACAENRQRLVADDAALLDGVAHFVKARLGLLTSLGQGGMALEGVEASCPRHGGRSRHHSVSNPRSVLHPTASPHLSPRRRTTHPSAGIHGSWRVEMRRASSPMRVACATRAAAVRHYLVATSRCRSGHPRTSDVAGWLGDAGQSIGHGTRRSVA